MSEKTKKDLEALKRVKEIAIRYRGWTNNEQPKDSVFSWLDNRISWIEEGGYFNDGAN